MLERLKEFESIELTIEENARLDDLCESFAGGCGAGCLGCVDNSNH